MKKAKRTIISFVLSLCMVVTMMPGMAPVWAEPIQLTFTISGTVTDGEGGPAISGAAVELSLVDNQEPSATATTTSSGIYSFSNIPEGSYQINVTAAGYADAYTAAFEVKGDVPNKDIPLQKPPVDISPKTGWSYSVDDATGDGTVTITTSGAFTVSGSAMNTTIEVAAEDVTLSLEEGVSLGAIEFKFSESFDEVSGKIAVKGRAAIGNIAFYGDGEISLDSGSALSIFAESESAIEARENLTISGSGILNVEAKAGAGIALTGTSTGKVLQITDAQVTAMGGRETYGMAHPGIALRNQADIKVQGSARVKTSGGAGLSGNDFSRGAAGLELNKGRIEVSAAASLEAIGGAGGGHGIWGRQGLTIAGSGIITASGIGAGAYGVFADVLGWHNSVENIHIQGGTIVAGNSVSEEANAYWGILRHRGGTLNGASAPATPYGIFVGDVEVTDKNYMNITGVDISGGTISYAPETRTLTLNNAKIALNRNFESGILSEGDLNLHLVGSNQIGNATNENVPYTYTLGQGISAVGKSVTVSGDGSLKIYDQVQGILAENLDMKTTGVIDIREYGNDEGMKAACALKASGGALTIHSGTLNLSSLYSNCLYGDNIKISGGAITAMSYAKAENPAPKLYAFNVVPTFENGYSPKVFAGASRQSAVEVTTPEATTFTGSNFVWIGTGTFTRDDGSGNGGSGGSSQPATPSGETSGVTVTTTATAKTGADGTAAAAVTTDQIRDTLAKAEEAIKKTGGEARVEIKILGAADAKAVETSIPKESAQALASANVAGLTVGSPVADLTFDKKALNTISGAASGDVILTASRVATSSLSPAIQQLLGNRPVYEFSVTSGGKAISQFGGNVTVSIPYTPAAGEDHNAIVVSYINAGGNLELVPNGRYDGATSRVVFVTDHFSQYAVGYNKINFSDVKDSAWYADAVSFLAAREITTGTAEGIFSPNGKLTRGQFMVMLMKAYGIAPDVVTGGTGSGTDNFADAGNTYYTGYLAAAKRLGLSGGVGDNLFAPKQEITRQEMFTLTYNVLKTIDRLPGETGETSSAGKADSSAVSLLGNFSDSEQISSWAKAGMETLVKAGIITGSDGKLSPKDTTTRAQMAQVLYQLMAAEI